MCGDRLTQTHTSLCVSSCVSSGKLFGVGVITLMSPTTKVLVTTPGMPTSSTCYAILHKQIL